MKEENEMTEAPQWALDEAADRLKDDLARIMVCKWGKQTGFEELAFWIPIARHAADYAVATLRNQSTAHLQAQLDMAVAALKNVLPYVLSEYFRCNGDKCRHPTCASCFGEDHADKQSSEATNALKAAEEALTAIQGKDEK